LRNKEAFKLWTELGLEYMFLGLEAIDELFDLLSESLSKKSIVSVAEHQQIVVFLKRLTRRYGTVRGATDALGTSRRRHPLVSRDKARSWTEVMAVMPGAVETTLKRHPTLKIHISKWLADRGSSLDERLEAYMNWLDSPIPEFDELAEDAHVSVNSEGGAPSEMLDATDEQAIALYRVLIADKRPGLTPGDRRPFSEEISLRESLASSGNAFAKILVAISMGETKIAEALLLEHGTALPSEMHHMLLGECAYAASRFDDAIVSYRAAVAECDSPACVLSLALTLMRANMGSAEDRYKDAIAVLTALRDRLEPQDADRVRTLIVIGTAWLYSPTGDRDANVSRAIEAIEAAIEHADREHDAHWWAEAHLQLGVAWQGRPTGKRVENIQRAITCFSRAEEVWSKKDFPEHWATIQNNLGHAWERLPTGHRAVNLQRAIDYFSAALAVREGLEHAHSIATLRNNLGNAWIQFPAGDHRENVLKGIEYHTAALEIWSAQDKRHEWAATQNNLGNALVALGDKAIGTDTSDAKEQWRAATDAYRSALEEFEPAATAFADTARRNLARVEAKLAGNYSGSDAE